MFRKLPLLALLVTTTLVALPSQVLATDAREAIRLCDKNPNCTFNVHDSGDVDIFVGDDVISCPQEGDCTCICTHRTSPGQILTPKSTIPSRPRGGLVLAR